MDFRFFSLFLFLNSCAFPLSSQDGVRRHLIVGVGMVTVHDLKPYAATVTNSKALGISLSDRPGQKFVAGYSSGRCVTVPRGAPDILIDVAHSPRGAIRLETKQPQTH